MASPPDDKEMETGAEVGGVVSFAEMPHEPCEEAVATHVPMAERLSLVSWGDGSIPPMPSAGVSSSNTDTDERDDTFSILSVLILRLMEETLIADRHCNRSSTMSVGSGVYDFVEKNGRTYHRYKEGKYLLPNDVLEQERLDLQHALFLLTTQGHLYLAPISDNPQNVLDFATGTGIWAIEIAQKFPGSRVLGTDLSPIQPIYLPSNCHFEIDDAEDEWAFSTKFDYIHGRAIASCFQDPSFVIRQAYEACAPGGYLELQDAAYPFQFAGDADLDGVLPRWTRMLCEGAAVAGRPLTNAQHYKRWMEEAGFEDVVERRFYWPNGPWAKGEYYKTLGLIFQENLLAGLEGISLKVLGLLGWEMEQITPFLAEVREEVKAASVKAYLPMLFVYGRKPLPPDN